MICPKCKKEIDLPFDVEICPYCNADITNTDKEQLEDSVIVTSNPFIENNIAYPTLALKTRYLDKYEIKEFLGNYYPFSYYSVIYNEKKFILQISKISPLDTPEIEKKLKKEFNNLDEINTEENISVIEYGVKNGNIFFLLEYFTLETLQDVLNTTTSLSEEFILHLMLFLSGWYKNISKPHIFLSPLNIVSLGNNQFKVLNYRSIKILSNFIKPFFYFSEHISRYLPPELLKGDRLITKKADIYSIGKIWEALIDSDFNISDKKEDSTEKKIRNIIENMTWQNYESRELSPEKIKEISENYLNQKSNSDFTTQKISVKDIILDESITGSDSVSVSEDLKEVNKNPGKPKSEKPTKELHENTTPANGENKKEDEKNTINEIKIEEIEEIKPVDEHIEEIEEVEEIKLEEIEPEIIIKKVTPPTIPVAPPSLNIKKVTEKEFKIAKKQLNKNPIDLDNLKILYSYYSDKEMIDEAFIVSNLLNFMNDKTSSHLLFKSGKNVDWTFDKSILTEENLQKILPQKIYFNTSGVMNVLYDILQNNLPVIKTIAPLSNYSILINDPEKKAIIKEVLKLSGLKDLKISLTNQDIYNEKSISTAIYQRDKFINIIMKKDLCEDMENTQFRVLMGKLVFLAHSSIVGNFLYDVQTIKDIFYGVMKFVVPSSRNMYNSKVSNILYKELEKQKSLNKLKRTDVLRLVMLMNEHLYNRKAQPDINESMKLIEIASDRFALIVSNNLNETLKTFLNYESINIKLSASERMKTLLKYILSDDYFQLRKDIKQSIKA